MGIEESNDAIKYSKDCADFKCLKDGTIVGEYKYCDLSLHCRQIDIVYGGKAVPMEAHYLPILDAAGNVIAHELFCTGIYDNRSLKERSEDDKVS